MTRKEDLEVTARIEAEKRQTETGRHGGEDYPPVRSAAPPMPEPPTEPPAAIAVVSRGTGFLCGYCHKPLERGAACNCLGWKAAASKLEPHSICPVCRTCHSPWHVHSREALDAAAAREAAPGAKSEATCPRCGIPMAFHLDGARGLCPVPCPSCGAPLVHGEFEAAGCGKCGAGTRPPARELPHLADALSGVSSEGEARARKADPLVGRWVTCEHSAEPHPYNSELCEGVIQLVPPPEDSILRCEFEWAGHRCVLSSAHYGPHEAAPAPLAVVLERWMALGKAGVVVSICYGPTSSKAGLCFSVDALSGTGAEFEKPFAAETFEQAVEIAETEVRKRGWLPN